MTTTTTTTTLCARAGGPTGFDQPLLHDSSWSHTLADAPVARRRQKTFQPMFYANKMDKHRRKTYAQKTRTATKKGDLSPKQTTLFMFTHNFTPITSGRDVNTGCHLSTSSGAYASPQLQPQLRFCKALICIIPRLPMKNANAPQY